VADLASDLGGVRLRWPDFAGTGSYRGAIIRGVSIEQVAAAAQAVVQRARSLFASSPQPPTAVQPSLESAAQAVTAAGDRAAVMSGDVVGQHRGFVSDAARRLTGNGHSDAGLHQTLGTAATVTQAGARELDSIAAQTRTLAAVAATARTPAAQRAVLQGLRTQVSSANSAVAATRQQSGTLAGRIRALGYQSAVRAQGAGFGQDLPADRPLDSPADPPPHGKDPRYWIDVTRIIPVPPGQLAPYGTKQIGPNLWYPVDDGQSMSGPPPAKWPLDVSTMTCVPPGQLGPYGTTELVPGVFAPDPRQFYDSLAPWSPPKLPIDVRDVIQVPPGQKAPWDYVEYLPGWWAPRVANTPH
jgi:hypothetical protein